MVPSGRLSERRAEQLLWEILTAQGWDLRRPPHGDVLLQQEYKSFPSLLEIFEGTSKSGEGYGLPEAVIVDKKTFAPLAVIETKANIGDLRQAVNEATKDYGQACIKAGYRTLAIGLAGVSEDEFDLRVLKWTGTKWAEITYDGEPIRWVPNRTDLNLISASIRSCELRPTVPSPEVLAERADEINRLLRESGINDALRPATIGAIMLALWSSQGEIRKSEKHILADINSACKQAFWRAKKADLSQSLRVDEANAKLAVKARRIVSILERLNVTVLTAEHDYLGQLYETFFRYTGGNTIGQYFTPRHVTAMMADFCEVGHNDIVLDPACGTGGFLLAAMSRILNAKKLSRSQMVKIVNKRLIGFEDEPITAALCVANMILRGDGSTGVRRDDCFTAKDYPEGKATIVLMNPPFPHEKTDVPPERFVERALEGLRVRGKLAVILPTSLLVKADRGQWRGGVLKNNTLLGVCQMPDELFQPFASSTTSIVVIQKGIPHDSRQRTAFVRLQYDGLTLKKRVRVQRPENQIPKATDALLNKTVTPGFSGLGNVSGGQEWGVGAYIPAAVQSEEELRASIDELLRRLGSFYVRYSAEVIRQRKAIKSGELEVRPYRSMVTEGRLSNAASLPSDEATIGGMFDILYGLKELHSREGIPPGESLIISPTEEYNGCYGWLQYNPLMKPPFVTVAQTGSIGEAFVQLEPCAVNDDCLVLLPKEGKDIGEAQMIIAAACLHIERWRFNYGRKLTPSRIAGFKVPLSLALEEWASKHLEQIQKVITVALAGYS